MAITRGKSTLTLYRDGEAPIVIEDVVVGDIRPAGPRAGCGEEVCDWGPVLVEMTASFTTKRMGLYRRIRQALRILWRG